MRVFFQDKDAMQNHPPNNNIIHNTQVSSNIDTKQVYKDDAEGPTGC